MKAELIEVSNGPRTYLGESPRWDGTAWWWVDAAIGEVWTRTPGTHAKAAWQTGRRTSLVQPEASGRVVVARDTQLWILHRRADDAWEPQRQWRDLGLEDGWLVNDGVADSRGRLWIGSIAPQHQALGGKLLRIEPDGTVTEAASGFTVTNGMAWDAGHEVLFHADTYERTIWAHRVDVESGQVLGRRPFVDFTPDDGLPDGVATDVDGGVWVAMYGAAQVRRYDAAGDLDFVIEVDPPQCTSVELGGPDGRDVLITTAREGYDDERSAREPLAGRLYRARSRYAGVPKPAVVVTERGTA